MKHILYSELCKLARNVLVGASLIAGFFLGVIINIVLDDVWGSQVAIMSVFFPLLSSMLVGSIWVNEYSDRTLIYILVSGAKREKIFIGKIISSFLAVSCCFISYVLGLTLSKPSIFLSSENIENMYIVPFCLVWAYTEILVLIGILCRSFSKTAMAAVLMILFNIFFYKLSMVHESSSAFLSILGKYTFYGSYISTYQAASHSLLAQCIVNLVVGFVAIIMAFVVFVREE